MIWHRFGYNFFIIINKILNNNTNEYFVKKILIYWKILKYFSIFKKDNKMIILNKNLLIIILCYLR